MISKWMFSGLLALCFSGQSLSTDSQAWEEQLQRGEVPVVVEAGTHQKIKTVRAAVLIDASPEAIWSVMTNCELAPEFVPHLKSCEVLDAGDDWEIIEHKVKYYLLWPQQRYTFKADYHPFKKISFLRIKGDLKYLQGEWLLQDDVDGQIRVTYSVTIDPGRLVPKFMVRRALRKDLPKVMKAFREQVLAHE